MFCDNWIVLFVCCGGGTAPLAGANPPGANSIERLDLCDSEGLGQKSDI